MKMMDCNLKRSSLVLSFMVMVVLVISACTPATGPSAPTKASQGASATATAAPAAATKPTEPTKSSERKEVTLVKSIRPILANTVAALGKGDIAAAKTAWAPYNGTWNGVEVYVNFRSLPIYQDLENNYEAKITEALGSPQPNAAKILPEAQAMLAKYDEAIQIVETGPAISPIFDDVADLRIARAPLRDVAPALAAGNIVGAKASFDTFTKAWPGISNLINTRSADAYQEIVQAIAQVNAAWQKAQPTAAELTPLVANVTNRYNYGLNLVNTAARKADLARTTYSNEDVQAAAGIRAIQAELKTSFASWNAGKYEDAADHAKRAGGELFAATAVSAPLKARALDAAVKKALDAYTAVAGAPGDVAKVRAANKDAVEAGEVALQGVVGQFWTDPKLAAAIASASQR